jgi:hypothetical protein
MPIKLKDFHMWLKYNLEAEYVEKMEMLQYNDTNWIEIERERETERETHASNVLQLDWFVSSRMR